MSFSNVLTMRQPDEGKCHICKRVFCCGKCRQKHQFKAHAIAVREPLGLKASSGGVAEHRHQMESGATTIYVFCPICERRPLLLREEMHDELLAHIETCHLPLRCRKCQRNYTRIDDLREFSKCVDQQQSCTGTTCNDLTGDTEASKVTVRKASKVTVRKASNSTAISTQTSPGVTPISLINMRWKAKSRITHEEFISDSVSSIRNLSSISNSSIRRSIGHLGVNPPETVEKGKVIRSTSTPLQVESVFAKPKEPITFNASNGGHVSSIYQEEPSPALESNPVQQPFQQRTWKMGARHKMSAATPLRQVMSKSIQKAFVEHGGMLVNQPTSGVIQRRVRLDLSEHNSSEAAGSSALDLRLSPAMRRTQSESSTSDISGSSTQNPDLYKRPFLLSAQKLTTESIIITRMNSNSRESSSTVFNSCESVEIIRSTSESAEVHVPAITPIRVTGGVGINKKQIKFETPLKSGQQFVVSGEGEGEGEGDVTKDQFFTPDPGTPERPERRRQAIVPRQLSGEFSPKKDKCKEKETTVLALVSPPLQRPRARPPLRECRQKRVFSGVQDVGCEPEDEDEEDEVFRPTNASTRNDKKQEGASSGRLWSLMSSMMRLPATLRGEKEKDQENKENAGSGSLIRRCASIAGSLVRPGAKESSMEDNQSLKRKRTQTLDNQYCSPLSPSSSSKRYRIRSREPIERMRRH
ncbi:mitosis initiation protein fs(1)Ya [Drosophila rhopaloa]|uniref:Mitosis initiation protein fs(1)Ya n=1 Tax=Drosophila rhopaloa TaxID=1041015 RepID=A0A6P4EWV8_DRORH|nr:mitosis initiation protein fs(1)Ya [Drosophila rhopaloa]